MRDDVADDEDGGTAIDFFDQRRKVLERADPNQVISQLLDAAE